MRKILIAGNWKMNKTMAEAVEFAKQIKAHGVQNPESLAIIAPYTQLYALKHELKGTGIGVGAQNVHFEDHGAYTGEISVPMLKEIDIDYCVVGHSERRQYYSENDCDINKKLKVLIAAGIAPVLCVGETLETRERGEEAAFVSSQIRADFDGIDAKDATKIVVAYEPIWAIGTGKTASPQQANEMCALIRSLLLEMYGAEVSDNVIIQYGGSMKPSNAAELLAQSDIDGGLIGGASLEIDSFLELAKIAFEAQKKS